jgi:hypothetical protein
LNTINSYCEKLKRFRVGLNQNRLEYGQIKSEEQIVCFESQLLTEFSRG